MLGHVFDDVYHAAVGRGGHSFLCIEAETDGLPHDDAAAVGSQSLGDEVEEGGFAYAVGSDDAYFLAFLEYVAVVVDHLFAVVAFGDVVHFQYFAADALGLHGELRAAVVEAGVCLFLQLVEGVDACLGFGAAGLGHAAHPVELGAVKALGFLHFDALVVFPFRFFAQIVVVVAAVVVEAAVVQFEDVLAHVVEEVAVVCHHEDGQPLARQEVLQPFNHLYVQMVGWLVEE